MRGSTAFMQAGDMADGQEDKEEREGIAATVAQSGQTQDPAIYPPSRECHGERDRRCAFGYTAGHDVQTGQTP